MTAFSSIVQPGAGTQKSRETNTRRDRVESVSLTLLALSVAVFVGAVISGSWLWSVRNDWLALLPVATLALLGMIDVVWVFHARTARRLAVLDAYAEREIARSRRNTIMKRTARELYPEPASGWK
jgi:hypothetical protein